jgi:TatD DNase family protein
LIPLTDTHCHLYREYFNDLPEVIARMRERGVSLALVPGYDIATSKEALELASREPGLLAAAGIHPTADFSKLKRDMTELERICSENAGRIAAIGETGIDLHWSKDTLETQKELFAFHLSLARRFDKPVIIHTRESAPEVVQVLRESAYGGRGIFHCFDGSSETLEWAKKNGFGVSFAGNVTFPGGEALRRLASAVPDDLILVETDSPFLAPKPVRGSRNEPANVLYVLSAVAEIKGWTIEHAGEVIRANFARILSPGISGLTGE